MRSLELLAPAKNLECGIAAIDHGADAVYIGAQHFGARAAAGNSLSDIAELCRYAHQFGAKVHVTVNTIIYDSELNDTLALCDKLAGIGVDALLIQDMGLLSMLQTHWQNEPHRHHPVLHASTQCDSRSSAKVAWLHSLGFSRVVLARELSVKEIARIHHDVPDVELETFVHGALCVSYSGVCYASQHCFGRSANRGDCAQFCRLQFDLIDSDGKTIERGRHLLSLKDLCQIDNLELLADAGASSFKIEGRLKDVAYVKNVVSAYSQRLNDIIARHRDKYCRASIGKVEYHFTPDLKKTFNRGYTTYFANGRQPDIFSPDTPKAIGEFVGHVKELRRDSLSVAGLASFANGDGLCFFKRSDDGTTELEGFRVNRAVGNHLYPYKMPRDIRPGMALYRNNDQAFERILSGQTAERRIPVVMHLSSTADGFSLSIKVEGTLAEASSSIVFEHQQAKRPQRENIISQLSRLGDTIYICSRVDIDPGVDSLFIPSSLLAKMRREAVDKLNAQPSTAEQSSSTATQSSSAMEQSSSAMEQSSDESSTVEKEKTTIAGGRFYSDYPYLYNIANRAAEEFYREHHLAGIEPAFEIKPTADALIMQCRHCLRYSLGYCVRRGGRKPTWHEPLYLELSDGRRFRLDFRCDECQMNIIADQSSKKSHKIP